MIALYMQYSVSFFVCGNEISWERHPKRLFYKNSKSEIT